MVLPNCIMDWFDIVLVQEEITDPTGKEVFVGIIHIYLDESDNRDKTTSGLRPNGFTEESVVSDFAIRAGWCFCTSDAEDGLTRMAIT